MVRVGNERKPLISDLIPLYSPRKNCLREITGIEKFGSLARSLFESDVSKRFEWAICSWKRKWCIGQWAGTVLGPSRSLTTTTANSSTTNGSINEDGDDEGAGE